MQMAMQRNLIAVVDDDVSHALALARLLASLRYRVAVFESAADFVRCAPDIDPFCMLLDVDLGSASGLDLARELSASGLEIPIIFMTGSQDRAIYRQCVDLGCIGFLRKPFPEKQLIDAIAKVSRIAA
jgi:FixJ family two-component response regulator